MGEGPGYKYLFLVVFKFFFLNKKEEVLVQYDLVGAFFFFCQAYGYQQQPYETLSRNQSTSRIILCELIDLRVDKPGQYN